MGGDQKVMKTDFEVLISGVVPVVPHRRLTTVPLPLKVGGLNEQNG